MKTNKTDIILAGVGGQGILSIAAVIGYAALNEGLNIKQAEVHGMSQRGGAVQSHLRLSSDPIYSDLIPKGEANLILSIEPLESLRYLPWLHKEGWLITSDHPVKNIANYPEEEKIHETIHSMPQHKIISAEQIACSMHAPKSSNMVMLGAASKHLPITIQALEKGIEWLFARKGEAVTSLNIKAFQMGKDAAGNT